MNVMKLVLCFVVGLHCFLVSAFADQLHLVEPAEGEICTLRAHSKIFLAPNTTPIERDFSLKDSFSGTADEIKQKLESTWNEAKEGLQKDIRKDGHQILLKAIRKKYPEAFLYITIYCEEDPDNRNYNGGSIRF